MTDLEQEIQGMIYPPVIHRCESCGDAFSEASLEECYTCGRRVCGACVDGYETCMVCGIFDDGE